VGGLALSAVLTLAIIPPLLIIVLGRRKPDPQPQIDGHPGVVTPQ